MKDLLAEGAATSAFILGLVLIATIWAYRATIWRFAVVLATVKTVPLWSAWRMASDPDFFSIEVQRSTTRALGGDVQESREELIDELNGLYRGIEMGAWAFAAVYAVAVCVATARGDHPVGVILQLALCFSGLVVAVEMHRRHR